MARWKDALQARGAQVNDHFDFLRIRVKQRMGWLDPINILPYNGYGTSNDLYLKGRVLEDEAISRASEDDTMWDNLVKTYKRFESDEIPYARVRVRFGDVVQTVTADDEGYFDVHIQPTTPLPTDRLWHEVDLELIDDDLTGQAGTHARGRVMVPPPDSDFGVVSDVDDTILQTDATSLLKMLRLTLFNNARTRLPFEGVAAFYQALQQGASGKHHNPIFYVSSSPWNLYDLLTDFTDVHDIPEGPFFLRDLGFNRQTFGHGGHDIHKRAQIEKLLQIYSDLPFILIGDSGQRDPEIYHSLVCDFPKRFKAVYIRDVVFGKRNEDIRALANEVQAQGGAMLLVANSTEAAEHAAAQGYIDPAALVHIRRDQQEDQAAPTLLEQVVQPPTKS